MRNSWWYVALERYCNYYSTILFKEANNSKLESLLLIAVEEWNEGADQSRAKLLELFNCYRCDVVVGK